MCDLHKYPYFIYVKGQFSLTDYDFQLSGLNETIVHRSITIHVILSVSVKLHRHGEGEQVSIPLSVKMQ